MKQPSFKLAVLSLATSFLVAGSARADSFTFTGTATFGQDTSDFFISGPLLSLYSAAPGAFAGSLFMCSQGDTCNVPARSIGAFRSPDAAPGVFSGGTAGGVTADTLTGSLDFSGSSFIAGSDPANLGTGPVNFAGNLMGFTFLPLGCENTFSCTSVGPEVFDVQLSGTGTVTASWISNSPGPGVDNIILVQYNFSGTANTVPEPGSLLLLGSGLTVLAGMLRRRLRG